MEKKLGLRTKIEAVIVMCVLLTVGIGSVMSVTRTITDTSDTLETYIRNSNGKYWEKTTANIQLAIDDLNSTYGGWVKVPAGSYTLTGESIRIWEYSVQLIGAGVGGYPAQTYECTEIKAEFGGSGYYAIHVGEPLKANMFSSVSNMIIEGRGASSDLDGGIWMENTNHCSIDNVYVNDFYMESPYPAVGINFSGDGTGGTYYNTLRNVKVRRCTVGVCFGYNANGNAFESGVISNSRVLTTPYPVGIWMRGSDTNWIGNVDIEDHTDGGATAVYMSSDATVLNRVCGVHKFMGTRFEDNDRMVYIDASAGSGFNNFIGCSFAGTGGEQVDWFTDGESTSFPSMYTNCLVATADGMGRLQNDIDSNMISNSNGKYWAATAANIQVAIDDLTTGGTVWCGDDITLASGITGKANVTLDFQRHTITPSSSFNIVTMKPNFQVQNAYIDVSGIVFTHTCFYFDGADLFHKAASGDHLLTKIENIEAVSDSQQGRFVWMDSDTSANCVGWVTIKDTHTYDFEYAFYLEASHDNINCWVNANNFYNIRGQNDKYFIYMTRTGAGVTNGNYFDLDFQVQADTVTVVTVDGAYNIFDGPIWYIGAGQESFNFTATSAYCHWRTGYVNNDYINISGVDNTVFSAHSGGFLAEDSFRFFYQTPDNPLFYIYGYDTGAGATKYGRMGVESSGNFKIESSAGETMYLTGTNGLWLNSGGLADINCFPGIGTAVNPELCILGRNAANSGNSRISLHWGDGVNDDGFIETNTGNITLAPNGNVVNIQDVLNLPPIAEPTYKSDGCLWHNATSSLLNFYDGSNVYEFNMTLLH